MDAMTPAPHVGALAVILSLSVVLTALVTVLLLRQYGQAVIAAMQRKAGATVPTSPPAPPVELSDGPIEIHAPALLLVDGNAPHVLAAPARLLHRRTRRGPWLSVLVYTLAGLAYAVVIATLWLRVSPNRAAYPPAVQMTLGVILVWIYAWPIVLTVNVIVPASWKVHAVRFLLYFTGLYAVMRGGWEDMPIVLLVAIGIPTILVTALPRRGVRVVAPLVFVYMVLWIGAVRVLAGIFTENRDVALLVELVGAALIVGVALSGHGWWTMSWLGWLHERKHISDRSLVVDAIWLSFTLLVVLEFAAVGTESALLALSSFVVFQLVSLLGFAVVNRVLGRGPGYRLLLLRVFDTTERSERLMAQVGARWRHAGSIQLIAGADLALENLVPRALLEFVQGRLDDRYIASQGDLERRLATADLAPDRDGRFRVTDFFCYHDTWQMTVARLVGHSDTVLMDLRGFGRSHRGCVFELQLLSRLAALHRTVLIVDQQTDRAFLTETLGESRVALAAESASEPPEADQPTACFLSRDDAAGVEVVLRSLATIASRQPDRPTRAKPDRADRDTRPNNDSGDGVVAVAGG